VNILARLSTFSATRAPRPNRRGDRPSRSAGAPAQGRITGTNDRLRRTKRQSSGTILAKMLEESLDAR
jgi:hypothetical protein